MPYRPRQHEADDAATQQPSTAYTNRYTGRRGINRAALCLPKPKRALVRSECTYIILSKSDNGTKCSD
jgi:hypothetical protein